MKCNMDSIPEEILNSVIMPYLSIKDLGVLGRVSKLWKTICDNNEIWKYHYLHIPPSPGHGPGARTSPKPIPAYEDLYWLDENELIKINKKIIHGWFEERVTRVEQTNYDYKKMVLEKMSLRRCGFDTFSPSNHLGLIKHTCKELNNAWLTSLIKFDFKLPG